MGTESRCRLCRAPPGGSGACIHHPGVGGAAQSHQSICQKTWSSAKGATCVCEIVRRKTTLQTLRCSFPGGKPWQRCNGHATRLQPLARERRAASVCLDDPPRPLELVELKHSQPHLRRCVTRLPWFLLTCWRRPHELQSHLGQKALHQCCSSHFLQQWELHLADAAVPCRLFASLSSEESPQKHKSAF